MAPACCGGAAASGQASFAVDTRAYNRPALQYSVLSMYYSTAHILRPAHPSAQGGAGSTGRRRSHQLPRIRLQPRGGGCTQVRGWQLRQQLCNYAFTTTVHVGWRASSKATRVPAIHVLLQLLGQRPTNNHCDSSSSAQHFTAFTLPLHARGLDRDGLQRALGVTPKARKGKAPTSR